MKDHHHKNHHPTHGRKPIGKMKVDHSHDTAMVGINYKSSKSFVPFNGWYS